MPSEIITPVVIGLAIFAIVHFAKTRSKAAAAGTPASQVNLIPERWTEPLRPLARRRMLTVVWLLLLSGAIVEMWSRALLGPFVAIGAWWVGMAISHTTRTMAERRTDMLDERMIAARNRAFRTAYYWLGGAAAILLFVIGNFADNLWGSSNITLDSRFLTGAAFVTILTVMHLPSAILAWTEDVI